MALGVALLAVLWQFLGINNFRVVNTKDTSSPPPQLSSLLSIVYGHILILQRRILRRGFSPVFLLADYEPIERPIILGGKRNDFRSAIRE